MLKLVVEKLTNSYLRQIVSQAFFCIISVAKKVHRLHRAAPIVLHDVENTQNPLLEYTNTTGTFFSDCQNEEVVSNLLHESTIVI